METHSSILAWRIPWTEETDRLQSMGSVRVEHDWGDLAGRQSNTRDPGWIPAWGRSPGEENGNSLQKSCWKISRTVLFGGLYSPWGHKRVGTDLTTKQWQQRTSCISFLSSNRKSKLNKAKFSAGEYTIFQLVHTNLLPDTSPSFNLYKTLFDGRNTLYKEMKCHLWNTITPSSHWLKEKAPIISLKLKYYLCFLKCWAITKFSSWKISPEELTFTFSMENALRTKHAHTGRNWAWL